MRLLIKAIYIILLGIMIYFEFGVLMHLLSTYPKQTVALVLSIVAVFAVGTVYNDLKP